MATEPAATKPRTLSSLNNSLSAFSQGMSYGNPFTPQISQTETLRNNNRWYLLSNDRTLLSELYVEHGIIQTLVDQPVDDAFRTGFEIKTGQLDADQIEELEHFLENHNVTYENIQGMKWARLFGGGAVLVITEQNPATPLDPEQLKKGSRVEFRGCDLWELYQSLLNTQGDIRIDNDPEFYDYYGHRVHKSRVFPMRGKQAPSFIRPRLRGWGMSEVERVVRSFNQYLKNQDVVFELLDEAKIDVYRIDGFNASLLNDGGTQAVQNRVQLSNLLKNYLSALVMDMKDEYSQKQMTFTGLGEMLTQIRQGIAADLKMPMTKLFGISAAGFSSGEDDIENYNSMIESEVRAKVKRPFMSSIQISCQILFGFIPDDLKIVFKPLRILNAEEEEKVKDAQFNRLMSSYQSGAIDHETFVESVNKATLLPVEIDPSVSAGEPLGSDFTVSDGELE